jgi:hypothetical protein
MADIHTAGPFGLQVGLILARQGISFRIVGMYIKQTRQRLLLY